uniref:Uncharacterized protein n=1 Tax=Monodon monoceros TaxID=40151 RepID=A0A8C6ATT5_MONMO
MWATCCNCFCLDGQPEAASPPHEARSQAYSIPGYSSFPSPTVSEPSCKACGAHFTSVARKANGHVSQDQEEPIYLESTARAPTEGGRRPSTQRIAEAGGPLCLT